MTTAEPTPAASVGTRRSMIDMASNPFGQWWSTIPTGVHGALVLACLVATAVLVW